MCTQIKYWITVHDLRPPTPKPKNPRHKALGRTKTRHWPRIWREGRFVNGFSCPKRKSAPKRIPWSVLFRVEKRALLGYTTLIHGPSGHEMYLIWGFLFEVSKRPGWFVSASSNSVYLILQPTTRSLLFGPMPWSQFSETRISVWGIGAIWFRMLS